MYAIVYMFSFIIGYLALFHVRFKYKWIPAVFVAICFGLLAASMVPRPEHYVDTKRFFSSLDQFRFLSQQTGFLSAWRDLNSTFSYSDVPLAALFIAVGSQFPSNHVFMFIVGFIISLGAVLIILQMDKDTDSKNRITKKIAFAIFFSWFNFQAAVQGVRNMIAFVVLSVCAYYLMNTQLRIDLKHVVVVCIGISTVWMHPSSILAIALIGITLLVSNTIILRVLDGILLTYGFFQSTILPFVLRIPFISNSVSLVFKTNQYLTNSGDNALSSSVSLFRDLLKDGLLILIITAIFFAIRTYDNKETFSMMTTRYGEYFIAIACLTIGSISNGILFDRLSNLLIIVGLPYLAVGLNEVLISVRKTNSNANKIFVSMLVIAVFVASVAFLGDNLRAGVKFYSMFY
ncbi:EpsG family protein [Lacticaseibacillus suibinensis]|uniref:EpsG family protein n=1 Tax=Lacticaseibacillus suibinensis TaxID=2486011 RepID=UPI001941C9F9|nr:EpsG family protein [Lacticaseibacillus suibinensis]